MTPIVFAFLFSFYLHIFMLQFFHPSYMFVWYVQLGLWSLCAFSHWRRWGKTYVWFMSLLFLNYWYIYQHWHGRMIVYFACILFLMSKYTNRPSYYASAIVCTAFLGLLVQLPPIDQLKNIR
jgi:hypothetical protein